MSDAFIGRGWRFPLRPDAAGRLGYVEGEANVAQSLELLLMTCLRERHMRPSFGSAIPDMVFAPGSSANLQRLEEAVERAVIEWEPRVELESVTAGLADGDPTRVDVAVSYRVRRTNTRTNLVFPYYLEGGG